MKSLTPSKAQNVMVVMKKHNWSNLFIDYNNNTLLQEGLDRKDNDISEDDKRYPFEG